MDQSDKPNLRPTVESRNIEKLQKDMMHLHGIDSEKELTEILRDAIKKEVRKEMELNTPSLETGIAVMNRMLEGSLPTFLREAILRNLIVKLNKKIIKDHCE